MGYVPLVGIELTKDIFDKTLYFRRFPVIHITLGNDKVLNGIDGNKKIKGIKRHVVVDKNGFLIAVMVTIANVHDSKAALLLTRVLKELCSSVKTIIADGGL